MRKYLTIFSRYLLWRKEQSKMFDEVVHAPLKYVYFVYIVYDQFLTVMWFKNFYQIFELIPEFEKVGLLLNYIKRFHLYSYYFQKCLIPAFFFFYPLLTFKVWGKSVIPYQEKYSFHYYLAKNGSAIVTPALFMS